MSSDTILGHTRRSVGSAWQIGFGNLGKFSLRFLRADFLTTLSGGIIATYIFPATDARNFFHLGYSVCMGFICLSGVSCVSYSLAIWTQNRNRDKAGTDLDSHEHEDDLSPNYRYMI